MQNYCHLTQNLVTRTKLITFSGGQTSIDHSRDETDWKRKSKSSRWWTFLVQDIALFSYFFKPLDLGTSGGKK